MTRGLAVASLAVLALAWPPARAEECCLWSGQLAERIAKGEICISTKELEANCLTADLVLTNVAGRQEYTNSTRTIRVPKDDYEEAVKRAKAKKKDDKPKEGRVYLNLNLLPPDFPVYVDGVRHALSKTNLEEVLVRGDLLVVLGENKYDGKGCVLKAIYCHRLTTLLKGVKQP